MENNYKFSKAPWKVMEYKTCYHGNPVFKRGVFSAKSRKDHSPLAIITGYRSKEESEANLRLIVAAPKLLDALEDVVYEEYTGRDGVFGYGIELQKLIDEVRG